MPPHAFLSQDRGSTRLLDDDDLRRIYPCIHYRYLLEQTSREALLNLFSQRNATFKLMDQADHARCTTDTTRS